MYSRQLGERLAKVYAEAGCRSCARAKAIEDDDNEGQVGVTTEFRDEEPGHDGDRGSDENSE